MKRHGTASVHEPPSFRLSDLAARLGGRLDAPSGADPLVRRVKSLTEADEGDITFFSDLKGRQKHRDDLSHTRASAVLLSDKAGPVALPAIRLANPHEGLARLLALFHPPFSPPVGLHPTAFVDERAEVDPTASIGPLAVIEAGARIGRGSRIEAQVFIGRGAVIGEDTYIHARTVVRDGCRVGDRCILNSGAVIGSDGFGFTPTAAGHLKVPQVGNVVIGHDVEIGANVTIDRATMEATVIGDGTKIDNLVHIAHNCVIGKHCLIVAQVGLSGSTILEDGVVLAGQVGTAGHCRVGKGATIAARGVVTADVEPKAVMSGFPLKPHLEEKRIMASLTKLPDLLRRVRDLEQRSGVPGSTSTPEPKA